MPPYADKFPSDEPPEGVADEALVTRVLGEHLATITPHIGDTSKPFLTSIGSDVDGTLRGCEAGAYLDVFLCDAQDAGIPVYLVTSRSPEEELDLQIRERISNEDFMDKMSFGIARSAPGMGFEDDVLIAMGIYEETYFNPADPQTVEFLKAWESLSPEQKYNALASWADVHQRHEAAIKPEASNDARSEM